MDSADIGYSISEINYQILERGEWAGKIGWLTVKSKDPYVYSFRIKKNGDVDTIVQRFGSTYRSQGDTEAPPLTGRDNEYPPDKFLVSSFQPRYSNPYGSSDLRAAYRAYFIKDWAWKFRAIFMEKWGSPTVVGSFPNGTSEARRKQLEEVLESIQQETTLTIPEDLKIELIRVATTANITEYERAIADLNKEILVGLLGSFLAVEEGKRTGARAAGQVHLWIAKLFIEALVYQVQEDINRQMIRRLVDLNYMGVVKYPKLKFELSRVEDLMMEMELDTGLQNMGFPLAVDYVAKKYGIPKAKDAGRLMPIDGADDSGAGDGTVLKPVATGFGAKAAGPSDKPSSNMTEQMREVFVELRAGALPEDPHKIGDLKDTYAHLVRVNGVVRHRSMSEEANAIAFDLAGQERAYYQKNKVWMDGDRAYVLFLERFMRGRA
jgi:hypothetical protein